MIKAVIFDCFGVLVVDALSSLRAQLAEKAPEKSDEIIRLLHASHRGLITSEVSSRQIAGLLGLTEEEYRRQIATNEAKNDELLGYVKELRQRGYKTAILSNISIGGIDRRFSQDEQRLFDTIVASADTGYAKPEAQVYEIAADKLRVRLDECVFTDDNESFCEAARGLGMRAILYNNFAQLKTELETLLG